MRISDSLSRAHARLQQSANLLDEKTKVLNQTTNRLDRNFDNRFILLYSAIFIGLVALVVMFLHFFVPSWDEIKQRRQLAEHYNLDLQMCTVDNTAKPCVRVMKKIMQYGENHDLCVIDRNKNEVKPHKGLTSFYYSIFKCSGTGYFLTILHRLPIPTLKPPITLFRLKNTGSHSANESAYWVRVTFFLELVEEYYLTLDSLVGG
jgi:hypothetical protein